MQIRKTGIYPSPVLSVTTSKTIHRHSPLPLHNLEHFIKQIPLWVCLRVVSNVRTLRAVIGFTCFTLCSSPSHLEYVSPLEQRDSCDWVTLPGWWWCPSLTVSQGLCHFYSDPDCPGWCLRVSPRHKLRKTRLMSIVAVIVSGASLSLLAVPRQIVHNWPESRTRDQTQVRCHGRDQALVWTGHRELPPA